MNGMAIPDFQTLMKPVLILSQEEQKFSESVDKISDEFSLSREDREERIPSGKQTTIGNRIAWAVSYLKQAGLIERKKRGFFSIAEAGKKVLAENPDRIDIAYLQRFPSFVNFRTRKKESDSRTGGQTTGEATSLTPSESIEAVYLELRRSVESELLDRILQETPEFFENLVVELLTAMGYGREGYLAESVGKSGDGGIDGIIHQDALGLDAVYIQAKRYDPSSSVGRQDIQKFVGALSGRSATKGIFITTSSYSRNVGEYLKTVQQRIKTIDGNQLVELMIRHGVGVREEETFTTYRIDEDFFSQENS